MAICISLQAATALAGPFEEIFPTETSCYLREYASSHLAKHPDQTVTRIALGPDLDAWMGGATSIIRLSLVLRDGTALTDVADCSSVGAETVCVMVAGLESVTITVTQDGIRLQLGPEGMSFETTDPTMPDAVPRVTISGTSGDDRVFDIPATRSSGCPIAF
jgi:hypothetical protein